VRESSPHLGRLCFGEEKQKWLVSEASRFGGLFDAAANPSNVRFEPVEIETLSAGIAELF